MNALRGTTCERARDSVSARLDGELSELEGARLDGHLSRCAACASFSAEAAAIADALRTAPLEPLRRPLVTPRRPAALGAARVTAAAAVMLVAAGLGGVLATSLVPHAQRDAMRVRLSASDDRQLRDIRREQLRIERAMMQTNGRTIIGHVI